MARSLPLFIKPTSESVTTSASTPGSTSALTWADAGVQLVGVTAKLASTGGKVTLSVYDGAALATAPLAYQVEFDFTSVTQTSDVQATPIPIFGAPSYTVQSDATGASKTFSFEIAFQKISIES